MEVLVINADNGCESSGSRTQRLKRLLDFATRHRIKVQLAYYPPYHSKYNPVERSWGVLENHWRGQLLSSIEKAIGLARSMRYAGVNPKVELVRKIYQSGVKVAKCEREKIEENLQRKARLEKWLIQITPEISG